PYPHYAGDRAVFPDSVAHRTLARLMIPVLKLSVESDRQRVEALLDALRLHPADLALNRGERARQAAAVQEILSDVARRGDDALVDVSRKFDDPAFSHDQIRVSTEDMRAAAARLPADQLSAIRRSIAQVREYQQHILPKDPPRLKRPGVEL